ncbi:carbohydrate ABC transporter substrate-binding protein [Granulicatella elegans]|jgi:carbohydrate ABC transporter, carbohydrate-binding protein|uniref:carbohydrate ABC transporter substrate-binding protein n=1 Tax=Granulicatella elegans TaxID=137732 RepID=UPI000F1AB1BA|nr:carbohydrate ABC transporter substrate-binding protein [Granulicatella elegans]RKW28720.1 MAG: carbohydrate ABC transporter substrate-binding protein [Granulicatella sp.]
MKKKLMLSSAALLATVGLVACNNKTTTTDKPAETKSGEKKTLKLAALESGYGKEMWPELIKAYEEANPNVKVELQSSKELEDELSPKMKAGDFPDVVMLALGRKKALPETLIKEKALADISDLFDMKVYGEDKKVSEKLLNGVLGSTVTDPYRDGKHYLAPMFYAPTGLFYNQGLFEQKGWEVPKDMPAMKELAEKAKAEGISLFTYPTTGYLDSFFPALLANAGGVDLFNKAMSYEKGIFASEGATKAFNALGELVKNVEPSTVANANPQSFTKNQQLLLDNKALFMPNGTWVVGEMKDAPRADGFKWAMNAAPAIEKGGKRFVYSFFEHIWVPEAATNKKEAKEFLSFLYSDKAAAIFAKHNAAQPIQGVTSKLPAELQSLYKVVDEVDGVINGNFIATKPVEGVNMKETLYGQIDSVASGQKSVADWQKSVEEVSQKLGAAVEK